MATEQQDTFLKNIGVPDHVVAGGAPAGVSASASQPAAAPANPPHYKFSFDVPGLPKKDGAVWHKRIAVSVAPSIGVTVDVVGGDQAQAQEVAKDKALKWHGATVEPLFQSGAIFDDPKLNLGMTEVSLSFQSSTRIGRFEWKLTLVGLGKGIAKGGDGAKLSIKVLAGEITWIPVEIHLGAQDEGTLHFNDIVIKPGGKIEVAPNYVEIIKEWAIKRVEEEVGEAVEKEGGEVAATVISFDAIIAGALAAVAVGTVLSVAHLFIAKIGTDKILSACATALRDLNNGVRAGLAGQPGGGTEMFAAGWDIGDRAHQDAIAKINADMAKPGAEVLLPEEFTERVRVAADKAVKSWPAWSQLDGQIRAEFWHRWADDNHGISTTLGEAKDVFTRIFGQQEDEKGPRMQYWSKQSFFNNKPGFWAV